MTEDELKCLDSPVSVDAVYWLRIQEKYRQMVAREGVYGRLWADWISYRRAMTWHNREA